MMLKMNCPLPIPCQSSPVSAPYVLLQILPGWTGEAPEELDHYLTAVPIKSSQTAESQQVFSISDNEQQHGVDPSSNWAFEVKPIRNSGRVLKGDCDYHSEDRRTVRDVAPQSDR